jgi:ATP-dependent Clp protease ATP-binding subunit ClpC
MFERFTEGARLVVVYAQVEALRLEHDELGTRHILLGLLRERDGIAAQALEELGSTAAVCAGESSGTGRWDALGGPMPISASARHAFELARRESVERGHVYVGVSHLLLGLLAEADSGAMLSLLDEGIDPAELRTVVDRLLSDTYLGEDPHPQPEA